MMRLPFDQAHRWVSPILVLLQILAVVVFAIALASFHEPENGFTQLVVFGEKYADQALPILKDIPHAELENSLGYDGQFYAQMALDPLLLDPDLPGAMDNPDYRFRRVFMPALAHAAGLGRPSWVLQAYSLLNGVCWFLLAFVLFWWFRPGDPDGTVRWFFILFGAGLLYSFRNALPDGPALFLMVVALVLAEASRKKSAALALALAGLTRETSLLGFGGLPSADDSHPRAWKRWIIPGLVAVVPLVLWLIYVRGRLAGLDLETGLGRRNFAWPGTAWIGAWVETFRWDDWTSRVWVNRLCMVIGLTVQMLFFLCRWRWRERAWRLGIVYALLGLILGAAVWEGYPPAAVRVLLPLTLAFNLALPKGRKWLPVLVAGNLSVVAANYALDAPGRLFSAPESVYLVQVTGPEASIAGDEGSAWTVAFSPEWYQLEYKRDREWRWSPGSASIGIHNGWARPVDAVIGLNLRAREGCALELLLNGEPLWTGELNQSDLLIEMPVKFKPGQNTLVLKTDDPPVQASWQDERMLLFRLNRIEIRTKDRL